MGGEPKTLKQIETAQSVLNDILEIIEEVDVDAAHTTTLKVGFETPLMSLREAG
jgi:hypothetical protein